MLATISCVFTALFGAQGYSLAGCGLKIAESSGSSIIQVAKPYVELIIAFFAGALVFGGLVAAEQGRLALVLGIIVFVLILAVLGLFPGILGAFI
jgi:hypothetical protein